jgi:hypothetical protein
MNRYALSNKINSEPKTDINTQVTRIEKPRTVV